MGRRTWCLRFVALGAVFAVTLFFWADIRAQPQSLYCEPVAAQADQNCNGIPRLIETDRLNMGFDCVDRALHLGSCFPSDDTPSTRNCDEYLDPNRTDNLGATCNTTFALDIDQDCLGDICDNCPTMVNPDQANADMDQYGDTCDKCPMFASDDQTDSDRDGIGDVCDNCPMEPNEDQADDDGDMSGDICDNCAEIENTDQAEQDGDGFGDACDICPEDYNPIQEDLDRDVVGDVCDNCPTIPNPDQEVSELMYPNGEPIGLDCEPGVVGGGSDCSCASSSVGAASIFTWLFVGLGWLVIMRRRRRTA